MRIGALINARLGSKRLPKKHLRDICGSLAIERLLERLKSTEVTFIIATGDERENKPLADIAIAHKVPIFFGDQHNIPNRHLQIARKCHLDAIISIDGDDVLTSQTAFKDAIKALQDGHDLVRTEGLPLGMNILWGYGIDTLIRAIQGAKGDGSLDTGWGWVFQNERIHRIIYDIKDADKIRATLDYPEDLKFFRAVFEDCPLSDFDNDESLCRWIVANRVNRINKKRF